MAPSRWHARPRRVVHAASSLALAQLEKLAQYGDRSQVPPHVAGCLDVPDDVLVEVVNPVELPPYWRRPGPPPRETQALGDAWLARGSTLLLRVPSAVSPPDANYLLNPLHADFARCVQSVPEAFEFDARLTRRR